jgi:hypothetical protein
LLVWLGTESGEYSEIFERNKIMVRLNKDYTIEITKYSVYFLNIWLGFDEPQMNPNSFVLNP